MTSQKDLTEQEAIKQHFEQNMLDGDKTQSGQMLSSEDVLEYLTDFLARHTHFLEITRLEAAVVEQERYIKMLQTGKWTSFAMEVTRRLNELHAALKKVREG